MRRSWSAAVVLMLLIALVACGGDADEPSRVYLIDGYQSELGMRGRLVARERPLKDPGLGRVVAEVLRGPTIAERDQRGLISGFPADVRVSTVAFVNGTATVRLVSDTPPQRWPDEFYATAQIVYTLTELSGVKRVVMTVNALRCCVYDMRQRPWKEPLTRRLFASWQGAPVDS